MHDPHGDHLGHEGTNLLLEISIGAGVVLALFNYVWPLLLAIGAASVVLIRRVLAR